ncbi:MAG: metallophosphoesterase family protein [Candidatus Hydrothermia bacterium]
MKILHTSDIHLHNDHPERFDALKKVLEKANEFSVDYLVIAGDLFQDLESAADIFIRLRTIFNNLPFRVIVIPGNHDYSLYETQRDLGNSAIVLNAENPIFEERFSNVTFFTVPYSDGLLPEHFSARLAILVQKLSPNFLNIFVYHGDLEEVVLRLRTRRRSSREERGKAFSVNLHHVEMLQRVKLVLAGHYHNAIDVFKYGPDGLFIYSGSPVSVTKSDTSERSVVLVEINGTEISSYQRIHISSFNYRDLVISLNGFEQNPVETVLQRIQDELMNDSEVRILLTLKGFINREISGIGEKEFTDLLVKRISSQWSDRVILDEGWNEVKDISIIMSRDFCRNVFDKIDALENTEEEKRYLKQMFIDALLRVK